MAQLLFPRLWSSHLVRALSVLGKAIMTTLGLSIAHDQRYYIATGEGAFHEALLARQGQGWGSKKRRAEEGERILPRVFQTSADCCKDRDEREETGQAPVLVRPSVIPGEPASNANEADAGAAESVAQGVQGKNTDDLHGGTQSEG